MKRIPLIFALFFIAACAPSKEQKAEAIEIIKQKFPNLESQAQPALKSSKGFEDICAGEWTYKVVGSKNHPIVVYGYFGHKSLLSYAWDCVKFLPTCLVGIVVTPSWHIGTYYAWDVDIPNHVATPHKGHLEIP